MIKYASADLQIPPVNRKKEPAARTNKKQENVDEIYADYLVKRSGVLTNRKKYKKRIFSRRRSFSKCKKIGRDPSFIPIDLPRHFDKILNHLVTQSLFK
jgi:hypothetical protein